MRKHFSPEEFVDLLDGTRDAAAEAHLRECDECRRELAAIQGIALEVATQPAPEPSPLFWDHFSARVARATSEIQPARQWWQSGWRFAAALTGAAAVVALMLVLRPADDAAGPVPSSLSADVTPDIEDDGSWGVVLGLASGVAWEDLRDAAAPAAGTADAAIAELDAAQREALVQLLKREMGEP